MGLEPGTVGYNNVMFNVLDLFIQAPAVVPKFIQTLAAKRTSRLKALPRPGQWRSSIKTTVSTPLSRATTTCFVINGPEQGPCNTGGASDV